ncbi:transposase [Rosistilla oblonga]|uniref:transposase n=1 Tax=Rosistilla oblonga TaxID=2527990 RepID=UPI003A977AD7
MGAICGRSCRSAKKEYPHVGGQPGRPRIEPDEVYADTDYDSEATRNFLGCSKMKPFIRKRSAPHGRHLGRIRWGVERSIPWLKGVRRLRFRYDRSAPVIQGWPALAMAILTFRICQMTSN